jgi:hypothetical protein
LCIQEYSSSANIDLSVSAPIYFYRRHQIKTGQFHFSKFPIIDQGNIIFPNSSNNVVFADVKKGKDIIRVYNMHIQSIKISPENEIDENIDAMNQQKSQVLFRRIAKRSSNSSSRQRFLKSKKSVSIL